ncbi:hypothetical protein HY251_09420 [bacterium]|nr:hypothetical protein [bacterium]
MRGHSFSTTARTIRWSSASPPWEETETSRSPRSSELATSGRAARIERARAAPSLVAKRHVLRRAGPASLGVSLSFGASPSFVPFPRWKTRASTSAIGPDARSSPLSMIPTSVQRSESSVRM